MLALGSRSPNSLIQSLLQSGADPHLVDVAGRTVLHWAARERNVWAIKWLIAENVHLEAQTPSGIHSVPKAAFHSLFDDCHRAFTRDDVELSRCLEYLLALQTLALAGANISINLPNSQRTQGHLTENLNWFIPRAERLSNVPCNRTNQLKAILREICDIVHTLNDTLCNPLSLTHLCRIQIRRLLGKGFRRKLDNLHLPLTLQEYLMVYNESDLLL